MSVPSTLDTLHDARTRWLSGDTAAWTSYAECCRTLETELRGTRCSGPSERPFPHRTAASRSTKRRTRGRVRGPASARE